jgi:RNA polymerase sigma factor (sigma-70 family)
MDTSQSASNGQGSNIDQESLNREIASLRTYLIVVARSLNGIQRLGDVGVSDLVDSVLLDAFERVKEVDSDFTFRSKDALKVWLAKRLKWTYHDRLERRLRHGEIVAGLPAPAVSRTPSSEAAYKEKAHRVREALGKLGSADRQVIEGRIVDGLTFREIGRRHGYSASYARRVWLGAKARFESVYQGIGKVLSR